VTSDVPVFVRGWVVSIIVSNAASWLALSCTKPLVERWAHLGSNQAEWQATRRNERRLAGALQGDSGSGGDGSERSETTRSDSALGQEADDDPDLDDDPRSQRVLRMETGVEQVWAREYARANLSKYLAKYKADGSMGTPGPGRNLSSGGLHRPVIATFRVLPIGH
jgi:hypothetical protein